MPGRPFCGLNVALAFALVFPAIATGNEIEDIVGSTYRNAVIRIDVSSNTAVFDKDGKNICKSEGTGFFINNRNTILTAKHVLDLNPACGTPVILAKSQKHNWERLAKLLDSESDVVLLSTEPVSDLAMCALLPNPRDAFETNGLRFGIPAGLTEPAPSALRIGEEHGQFQPLIMLNPAPVRGGESGGPVLYRFNVTGLVKARHLNTDYGLMIQGSVIRLLLTRNKIARDDAFACNPSKYILTKSGGSNYTLELILAPVSTIRADTRNKMAYDLFSASEKVSNQPVYFNKVMFKATSDNSVTVETNIESGLLGWFKTKSDSEIAMEIVLDVNRNINDTLIDKWWSDYLISLGMPQNSLPTCGIDSRC